MRDAALAQRVDARAHLPREALELAELRGVGDGDRERLLLPLPLREVEEPAIVLRGAAEQAQAQAALATVAVVAAAAATAAAAAAAAAAASQQLADRVVDAPGHRRVPTRGARGSGGEGLAVAVEDSRPDALLLLPLLRVDVAHLVARRPCAAGPAVAVQQAGDVTPVEVGLAHRGAMARRPIKLGSGVTS